MKPDQEAVVAALPVKSCDVAHRLRQAAKVGSAGLVLLVAMTPDFAHAQAAGSMMGGVTDFLRLFVNLLIFEWGYYIGIITLAYQGMRWWGGRISLEALGVWGLGVALVFFAPSIVQHFRNSASAIT